jgi:hypothetical protein
VQIVALRLGKGFPMLIMRKLGGYWRVHPNFRMINSVRMRCRRIRRQLESRQNQLTIMDRVRRDAMIVSRAVDQVTVAG